MQPLKMKYVTPVSYTHLDFNVEKTAVNDGEKSEEIVLVGEERASFDLKTLQNEPYNENSTNYTIV